MKEPPKKPNPPSPPSKKRTNPNNVGSNDRHATRASIGAFLPRSEFISRILFVVFIAIMIWLAYAALPALILFFAAIVLAVVFHGCSRSIGRFIPGGQKITLTLTILLFIGLFSAAILLLVPKASDQFEKLLLAASDVYERFTETAVGQAVLNSESKSENGEDTRVPFNLSWIGKAASWATNAVRTITSLGLVFVLAVFIAASPKGLRAGVVSLFPLPLRLRVGEVVDETAHSLWNWTIGQGFSMLVIGLLSIAIYTSIGLDFALTLGLIAGIFQFIPYLGPTLSAIPALIVAFSMSAQMALWAALAYAFIQTVEGNFITPLIMKRQAYLPPVLAIMSTVVFALLFGLAGAALATPLVIVLLTLYREVYQKDILGARIGDPRS